VTDPTALECAWAAEFELGLARQRRAETMLLIRGILIVLVVTALVVLRSVAL